MIFRFWTRLIAFEDASFEMVMIEIIDGRSGQLSDTVGAVHVG